MLEVFEGIEKNKGLVFVILATGARVEQMNVFLSQQIWNKSDSK